MERGSPSASRPILIGRLALLLVALAAAVTSFAITRRHDHGAATAASSDRYACPMHPQVSSPRADDECPICHMALERLSGPQSAAPAALTDRAKRREFTKTARGPASVSPGGLVEAVFSKADLVGVKPGQVGLFFRAAAPTVALDVRLATDPPVGWDSSTAKTRFRLEVGAAAAPGETGWVTLPPITRDYLVVPSNAVLPSPLGPYVLAMSPRGDAFSKRPVEIGKVLQGVAVVLTGLSEDDRVVAGDAFFVEAQQRVNP